MFLRKNWKNWWLGRRHYRIDVGRIKPDKKNLPAWELADFFGADRLFTIYFNPKLAEKHIYEINKLVEKAHNLKTSQAKRSEFGDYSKYVTFIPTDKKGNKKDGKIKVEINEEAIEKAKKLAGYNLIVTSELSMTSKEIYDTYHNLWRIEESFRAMKSKLDARPVYLQK